MCTIEPEQLSILANFYKTDDRTIIETHKGKLAIAAEGIREIIEDAMLSMFVGE